MSNLQLKVNLNQRNLWEKIEHFQIENLIKAIVFFFNKFQKNYLIFIDFLSVFFYQFEESEIFIDETNNNIFEKD